MPVKVGDPAPDFELPGAYDKEAGRYRMHRLSEALKERPMVLHFFPAPFTAGCQLQMCTVRDNVELYQGQDVEVWGVTAHSPAIIAAWAREHRFGVPILADYDREVSETYVGLYGTDVLPVAGNAKRAVVSIGRDGIVRYVWITDESSVTPDEQVVAEAIAAARE